jgi:hypothetical protein
MSQAPTTVTTVPRTIKETLNPAVHDTELDYGGTNLASSNEIPRSPRCLRAGARSRNRRGNECCRGGGWCGGRAGQRRGGGAEARTLLGTGRGAAERGGRDRMGAGARGWNLAGKKRRRGLRRFYGIFSLSLSALFRFCGVALINCLFPSDSVDLVLRLDPLGRKGAQPKLQSIFPFVLVWTFLMAAPVFFSLFSFFEDFRFLSFKRISYDFYRGLN